MAATSPELGVAAGRLLELSVETNLPEPYIVTDKITVAVPTKKRSKEMHDAQMRQMVFGTLLNAATGPLEPGDKPPTDDELTQLTKMVDEAENDYNKAFFGDTHDALMAFFEDQPRALWDAFVADIKKHFLPAPPPDGKCPTCGTVVDEEQAGKLPTPSI